MNNSTKIFKPICGHTSPPKSLGKWVLRLLAEQVVVFEMTVAENELSVLTRQCLNVRIGTIEEGRKQVSAWTTYRNDHAKGINRQFTAENVQIKLKSIYPTLQFKNK